MHMNKLTARHTNQDNYNYNFNYIYGNSSVKGRRVAFREYTCSMHATIVDEHVMCTCDGGRGTLGNQSNPTKITRINKHTAMVSMTTIHVVTSRHISSACDDLPS